MKKVVKIIAITLAIIISLGTTFAFFYTHSQILNIFKTEGYTFKINANGGTFQDNNVVVENNKTQLPNPTKKGYEFKGYSKNQNGNVDYGKDTKIDVSDINDKVINAVWEVITYSIQYNLNGGTATNLKNNYTVEDTFTIPNPTKTGYTFTGWTGSNGSSPRKDLVVPKGTTGNLSYAANWQVNSYLVDVNANISGSVEGTGRSGFTFDVYVNNNLVANDVIDWAQNVEYGSTVRVVANDKNGYTMANQDVSGTVGTNGLTFTPTWNIITYNIQYNLNGGAGVYDRTYNVETEMFTLPRPTRTGYTFTGWTGSNGGNPQLDVLIPKGTIGNKSYLANWNKINARATGITIYTYRSEDGGASYTNWANGPWGNYYTNSVRISDIGTWDLVVENSYVELKGTTVVVNAQRCYKLEVYAGNNGRNGEFLGSDIECTVNENGNKTSKAYLSVGW